MPFASTKLAAAALCVLALNLALPASAADPAAPASRPIELVYGDALDCAAFDGFSAVALEGSEGELAQRAHYYNKAGDLWLDTLIQADPAGEAQTMKDFNEHVQTLVLAYKADLESSGADKALDNVIEKYGEQCAQLEAATFVREPVAANASEPAKP